MQLTLFGETLTEPRQRPREPTIPQTTGDLKTILINDRPHLVCTCGELVSPPEEIFCINCGKKIY